MERSLAEIAELVSGDIKGEPGKMIRGAAPFETATGEDITYAGSAKFLKNLHQTGAGTVIIPRDEPVVKALEAGGLPPKDYILAVHPYVAFAKVLGMFYPPRVPERSISPRACIGRNFTCGEAPFIGAGVVIGDNVTLGDRAILYPNTVIGDHAVIGDHVRIYPNVTILDRCRIGNRVIIHAGTVIGSDGFGFAPDGEQYHKIPHTGIVQIDDDVEIGAGNTIDRATFGKTWIKSGVKTDNLVHIAHNVTVGENSVFVAQVGIAGSATLGNHVILAGQAGVGGHLTVGNRVTVGPRGGVTESVPDGEIVSGMPHMPHRLWLRVQRIIPRLPELKKKIEALEKKVNGLK